MCRLRAANECGWSQSSEASEAATLPAVMPTAPTIKNVSLHGPDIELSWLPPECDGGAPILFYEAQVQPSQT